MNFRTTLSPGDYFGELTGKQHRAHLLLTQTQYAPFQAIPDHCHEQAYFCLTLDGSHKETFQSTDIVCPSHSVRFHPAQSVHRNQFDHEGGRCFNIELGDVWRERLAEFDLDLTQPMMFNEGPLPFLAHRVHEEFEQADEVSALAIEGLTLEIFSALVRSLKQRKHQTRWLRAVQTELSKRYLDTVSLDELAAIAGVHPVYLARAFRKAYGCSIGQYVRRMRIDHAKKLLETTHLQIGEIAIRSGFSDQSHFTKVFRAATGLTPRQFKQAL